MISTTPSAARPPLRSRRGIILHGDLHGDLHGITMQVSSSIFHFVIAKYDRMVIFIDNVDSTDVRNGDVLFVKYITHKHIFDYDY